MRKQARAAAIIILSTLVLTHCVVKKDTAASAATSAALAKKIAQGLSGGSTAPSAMQPGGPSAAVTLNCSTTFDSNFNATSICTSDTFDFYLVGASGGGMTGYEKFKGYSMSDAGQTYNINGQINFSGTSASSYTANYAIITTTTNMTFNGTLAVSGADSFSVTYKNYKVNTIGTYTSATFSYQYSQSCSGTLTVDTIDYTIQADCTIAN